jgi:hypothetical protein
MSAAIGLKEGSIPSIWLCGAVHDALESRLKVGTALSADWMRPSALREA